jgi:hypothetical protein
MAAVPAAAAGLQQPGLSQGQLPGLGGTPAGSQQQVLTPLSAADIAGAAAEGLDGSQLVDRLLLTQLASQQVGGARRWLAPRSAALQCCADCAASAPAAPV